MKAKTDDLATRFLLGELSEEQRQEVEQKFLSDNEFFEQVLAAEDALGDQFLLGRLSEAEHARAKSLFESSHGQQQTLESSKELLTLVRQASLKSYSSAIKPATPLDESNDLRAKELATTKSRIASEVPGPAILQDRSWSGRRLILIAGLAIALMCFLLVVVIVDFYAQKRAWDATRRSLEQNSQAANQQLQLETQRREQIARQLEIEIHKRISSEELIAKLRPNNQNRITSLFLTPSTIQRANDTNLATLKTRASRVQLQLELDPSWHFTRYGALITTFEGAQIFGPESFDSSHIKQGKLELLVPGSLLKPQDYRIALTGWADNGDLIHLADYVFKVRK